MKIAIVVGTRPEIIKMSPVMQECENRKLDYFVLHTGQHYAYNLDGIFFEELGLSQPRYNLDVGSASHGRQTARILVDIEDVLLKERPDVVLVEGDTNTVLAGAVGAVKLHIKVGHVEAGLRSYDRTMPEEINRILADHISDYSFAPTEKARDILLGEGIPAKRIFVTGNTIVDAVYEHVATAGKRDNILAKLALRRGHYFLVTAHRQENVDVRDRLQGILRGLESVYDEHHMPLVYPIHPRTRDRIERFGLEVPIGIELIEPVGFLDFLQLEAHAALVLTDSGGVQEEACVLRVPCVTLRDNTERPETLEVGSNSLAGTDPDRVLAEVRRMLARDRDWANPFGDGKAAQRVIEAITDEV
jgi:UDP-N-acetylglucosamine 2-epimerase (non-hydrolysing)